MRARALALAGVAGPVAFTAAWIAASARQPRHGVLSVQLSGLAAAAALAVFIPNDSSASAGLLQRIAVTVSLMAVAAVAVRLTAGDRDQPEAPVPRAQ